MKIDRENLPKDINECHALIAGLVEELDVKERRLRRVLHQLEKLLRWRYGPKRERADENQLFLFAVALVGTGKDIEAGRAEAPKKKPRHAPHGRQRLPKHLERRRVVHDLSPDERQCPECQGDLRHIGEEKSERMEYMPASWFVQNTEGDWSGGGYYFDIAAPGNMNINEEWWGIVALSPELEKGLNKRMPRKIYYELQKIWRGAEE